MLKRVFSFLLAAALFSTSLAQSSFAQTQALKSFAYASSGCTSTPSPLLTFNGTANWQMGVGSGMAGPGAGVFPTGNFYVRAVSITVVGGASTNWALIGHSGPNGDWTTGAVPPGQNKKINFPADAAPLYTAGEYFDAHVSACDGISILVSFWWVPAP